MKIKVIFGIIIVVVIIVVVIVSAFLLGGFFGVYKERQRRFAEESRVIEKILQDSKISIGNLELLMYTGDGTAFLIGEVRTRRDFDRLRDRLDSAFGTSTEVDRMCGISLTTAEPNPVHK